MGDFNNWGFNTNTLSPTQEVYLLTGLLLSEINHILIFMFCNQQTSIVVSRAWKVQVENDISFPIDNILWINS